MSVTVEMVVLLMNTLQKGKVSPVSASLTVPMTVPVWDRTSVTNPKRKRKIKEILFSIKAGWFSACK
jgi:hypothetical protein